MKQTKKLIPSLVIIFLLNSCTGYVHVPVTDHASVGVGFHDDNAALVGLSLLGIIIGSAVYESTHEYKSRGLSALDINIKPSKADIFLDGVYVGKAHEFDGNPSFLIVKPGTHTVKTSLNGYRDYSVTVTLSPGQQINLNKQLEPGITKPEQQFIERPVPHEPLRFRLAIKPETASIYVDETFIGTGKQINQLHGPLIVDSDAYTLSILTPYAKKVIHLKNYQNNEIHNIEIDLTQQ